MSTAWNSWAGQSLLSTHGLQAEAVDALFEGADRAAAWVQSRGSVPVLSGRVIANVFYEPSSRTSGSFAAAAGRLGATVLSFTPSTSSMAKGESIADTAITAGSFADVVVQRHPAVGSAAEAAAGLATAKLAVPLLNAGDGTGQHPTQALLDLYTIRKCVGTLQGRVVVVLGDLKHGRTVHSLVHLLAAMEAPATLRAIAPGGLALPDDVAAAAAAAGITVTHHDMVRPELLADASVLYVTRLQKERFPSAEAAGAVAAYRVTAALADAMPTSGIIMHPLPRVDELDTAVDTNPRAQYFAAMRNGLYVRMALLAAVCGEALPAPPSADAHA